MTCIWFTGHKPFAQVQKAGLAAPSIAFWHDLTARVGDYVGEGMPIQSILIHEFAGRDSGAHHTLPRASRH